MWSSRNITETSCGVFGSMEDEGIRATKAYSYLKNGLDGSNSIGFTLKDCHNSIQSKRRETFSAQRLSKCPWSSHSFTGERKKMFIILYTWMMNLE